MRFNFDELIDRRYSNSKKWNKYIGHDIIPLWIADTDFRSPECIINALNKRVSHGIFGYGVPSSKLYEIFINRMQEHYKWNIEKKWLIFLPGTVYGLNLAVKSFTNKQERTIIPFPIYYPFIKISEIMKRQQLKIPVILNNGRWLMNLKNIENDLVGNEKLLMLCNPYNPGGTVYKKEELEEQLNFALRNNILICSDEVHSDIILNKETKHIPIASLNKQAEQITITLMSPSKAFNIAGLGISIAIIPNPILRNSFIEKHIKNECQNVNILAYTAAEAAYSKEGEIWLNYQLEYLRKNKLLLIERINKMKFLSSIDIEGTYLAWIDASELPVTDPQTFFEQAGVGLSSGKDFGNEKFVRLNFGCPRHILEIALDRMEHAIKKLN